MFSLTLHADTYPQRRDWRDLPWLDRIGEGLRVRLAARLALRAGRREALVARVLAEKADLLIQFQELKKGRSVQSLRFTFIQSPQQSLPLQL